MLCTLVLIQIAGHPNQQKILTKNLNFDPVLWVNSIQSIFSIVCFSSKLIIDFLIVTGIGQLEDATAAGHFDFIRDLL